VGLSTKVVSPYGLTRPYSEYNEMQSGAIPLVLEDIDSNLVVCAETGSGKTELMLALIAMTLNPLEGPRRKVFYTGPLKALVEEKLDECRAFFPDAKVEVLTGDYTISERKKMSLDKADIVLMTPEMMDARIRNRSSENNAWLFQGGAWIIDEFHTIDDPSRGDKLEAAIMRFGKNIHGCRILALSATMDNVSNIKAWLDEVTGRLTKTYTSKWRAVKLEYIWHTIPNGSYWVEENARLDAAVDLLESLGEAQCLFFSGNKMWCTKFVKRVQKAGLDVEVGIHNADRDRSERKSVEQRFREGSLGAIAATTTLAIGCNLPAEHVAIVHEKLGITPMGQSIRRQMAGRAGRPQYHKKGYVHIFCVPDKKRAIERQLAGPCYVNSQISKQLAFHILASIVAEEVMDEESLQDWYEHTFARFQNTVDWDVLEAAVAQLVQYGMVHKTCPWTATFLGQTASKLYMDVHDAYGWVKNFRRLQEDARDEEIAIALADVKSNQDGFISSTDQYKLRVQYGSGGVAKVASAYIESLNVDPREWNFGPLVYGIRADIERTGTFLHAVRQACSIVVDPKRIALRVKYGVKDGLVDLCTIDGIGGKRAVVLWRAGIKTLQDLLRANRQQLEGVLGEKTAAKAIENAKELIKAANKGYVPRVRSDEEIEQKASFKEEATQENIEYVDGLDD